MKLLTLLSLTLISLPLSAQTAPTPTKPIPKATAPSSGTAKPTRAASRRVVLPPSSRSSAPTRARPANSVATSRPAPAVLQENITIQLKGSTGAGEVIDLSLTGVGPVFQSDVFIGEEDTILTHTYSVIPQGSNYLVEFSIGTRIKIMTASNGPTKSFQYRDNLISGKVLLKPGKPVTVSNNQGKVLALTVSQP